MKRLVFAILYHLGIPRFLSWLNRRNVVVLCYHGVTGGTEPVPGDQFGLHVRRQRFMRQLDYLEKRFRVISLRDYLKAKIDAQPLPSYPAVLTFDDGFRNFFTVAAPALKSRNLDAALFVVTDWVNRRCDALMPDSWTATDDAVSLGWSEVRQLADAGFEIGSHTCSHRLLTQLPLTDMEGELAKSLSTLRDFAPPPIALAYPKGDYDDRVVEQVRTLGYSCALTTDAGADPVTGDRFRVRRTLVGDHDDEATFAVRVSGLAAILSSVARRFRRADAA